MIMLLLVRGFLWKKYRKALSLSSLMFSPLLARTFQYIEHTWVVKVLLLLFLRDISFFLSKVNKQFSNMTQAP